MQSSPEKEKTCRTKVRRSQAFPGRITRVKGGSRGRKNHLPCDNTHGHRGVSASSSRDGAIRFCTCLEKQGSHRGLREHREKTEENSRGQLLSWHVLKKAHTEGTENTEEKLARDRALPEKDDTCQLKSRRFQAFLGVWRSPGVSLRPLCTLCETSFGFEKTCRLKFDVTRRSQGVPGENPPSVFSVRSV